MVAQVSPSAISPYLRRSLKRGFAREAFARAKQDQADHAAIFRTFSQTSPNRCGLERAVIRLRRMGGVALAGITTGRLVVVLRNSCTVVTRTADVDVFTEEGLIYSRLTVEIGKGGVTTQINRATFCLHALERLVERSACQLGRHFFATVDTEAAAVLRQSMTGNSIEHDGDSYVLARESGIWAGSHDLTDPEPEWGGLMNPAAKVPTFSVRTFLGPDEMKPCLWLRWQEDPRLSMAA
jgi:hypothetical protein